MGKTKVKMFYDVVSPYSWMGVTTLRRYRDYWDGRIDVEFVPFFLGGIMAGANNHPPAQIPAKGKYLIFDIARHAKLMGIPRPHMPTTFPIMSYKQMRIICALKDAEDRGEIKKDASLDAAEALWYALWAEDKNTSEESVMQSVLDPILPGGWEKWKYAVSDPAIKKRLTDLTQEALDAGSFGAPWWVITNSKGRTEDFFGSDRWEHIMDFIDEEWLGYFPGQPQKPKL